ncbi:MAG: ABC transporter substrate-binding protein [Antricoccus sp.]
MKRLTTIASLGLAALIGLSGCSTKGNTSGTSDSGGIKTDFGVDKDSITLGINMDHSGVFKTFDVGLLHGTQIWLDEVNKAGGVCGRKIKLDDQDNNYASDKAVTIYAAQKTKIVGYIQVGGSPTIAALKSQFTADQMIGNSMAWASTNLDNPYVMMLGGTYDIDAINGLAYLQKQGSLTDGDKIGHVYIDSEYGKDALLGTKFYASKHNQTIVEAPVGAGDTDMAATVTKLKSEGVKAVYATTTAAAMTSIATQMANQNLNVPLIGTGPTYQANLMQTPAKDVLVKNYLQASNVIPFTSPNVPKMVQIAAEYQKLYSADPPDYTVPMGYASGLVWQAILEKACDNKDMTRPGLLKAFKSLTSVDVKGLLPKLDFSKPGSPSTRETIINVPDPSVPGNLSTKQAFFESPEAKAYKAPEQK